MQAVHGLQYPQVALLLLPAGLGHPLRQLGDAGQELVQRTTAVPRADSSTDTRGSVLSRRATRFQN